MEKLTLTQANWSRNVQNW